MQGTSEILEQAIEQLAKLPGTGRKSARRIALYLLKQDEEYVTKIADALVNLKKSITRCSICGVISDNDPCSICENVKRDGTKICVVEES
ncbi:MAG: recombination protein RecR, partial [Candidatus Halalkalibacterium sp. M3_1C_030]